MSEPSRSTAATITAICRVHQILPDAGTVGFTAIDKRPISGTVKVTRHGIVGDTCLDREHHGSLDQAVYLYADEAAAEWEVELGALIAPGYFGENVRTRGIALDSSPVGTIVHIGATVRLQLAQPRIPCATFARWVEQPGWVRRFTAKGLPGAYARVLTPGKITTGDAITIEHEPTHGVTIRDLLLEPHVAQSRLAAFDATYA